MKKWKPALPKQWKWHIQGRFRSSTHDGMTLHVMKEQFNTWTAILEFLSPQVTTCKAKVEGFHSCRDAVRAVETALLLGRLVKPYKAPAPGTVVEKAGRSWRCGGCRYENDKPKACPTKGNYRRCGRYGKC